MKSRRPWTKTDDNEIWKRMNHETGALGSEAREALRKLLKRSKAALRSRINVIRVTHEAPHNLNQAEVNKILRKNGSKRPQKKGHKMTTTDRTRAPYGEDRTSEEVKAQLRGFLDKLMADSETLPIIFESYSRKSRRATAENDFRRAYVRYVADTPGLEYSAQIGIGGVKAVLLETKYRGKIQIRHGPRIWGSVLEPPRTRITQPPTEASNSIEQRLAAIDMKLQALEELPRIGRRLTDLLTELSITTQALTEVQAALEVAVRTRSVPSGSNDVSSSTTPQAPFSPPPGH